ncbi:MAG: response regulator [Candidatus Thermoplasmatota archaeon]
MGKKIMVVDDSQIITYTVKEGLEHLDSSYSVIEADSGKKCFELLEKNIIPDIILLDIMMPGMNGWQVYKQLRKNEKWKRIPVAFLTAKTDNFSRGFGKILADAYIEKPFDIKELKERIDKLLEKPYEIPETKQKVIDDALKYIPEEKS